jgi:hypothetical protein
MNSRYYNDELNLINKLLAIFYAKKIPKFKR